MQAQEGEQQKMIRLMDWCGFSAVNIRGVAGDVTDELSRPLVNI